MTCSESFLYRRMTKRQPGATGTLAEPEGTVEARAEAEKLHTKCH